MLKRYLLLLIAGLVFATSAEAGFIFGRKKEKIDPKSRVPELITVLRSDRDPDRRSRAAEELKGFDVQMYPDIIPALISALQTDPKSGVRSEAANSLGKIRPVNQSAGEALEAAVSTDSAMRVRLQARSALMQYQWAGYRSGKKTDVPPIGTNPETPIVGADKLPPAVRTAPEQRSTPMVMPAARFPSSKEPPLAAPIETTPRPDLQSVPSITPITTPTTTTPVPVQAPPISTRPQPLPSGDGPQLP